MTGKARNGLIRQAGIPPGIRRTAAYALAVAVALALVPELGARATERADRNSKSTVTMHADSFGEHVKRDAQAAGAAFKETAHRVGVAAKAVGHEIATAAKRGATETRSAMRGENVTSTAPSPTR